MNIKTKCVIVIAILFVTSCAINRPTVTQITLNPATFMVSHPLTYSTIDEKYKITVPVGFITDLASIPELLWWWESPHEKTMAPAILHDYLYWEQSCTKDEADAVMYLAMQEVGVNGAKLDGIYLGIRTPLAQKAWDKNAAARKQGESRFLTKAYARALQDSQIDPGATLGTIQIDALNKKGIYMPVIPNAKTKSACKAALKKFNS
jgi:hypothetical protein